MTLEVDVAVRRAEFRVEAAFTANAGETVALLGPNGAGKSTLVAALAGLLPPERGHIALDGRVLDDHDAGVHVPTEDRRAGVVFQDRLLFPHLTAVENVAFPLRATGVPRATAHGRAFSLLDQLGVAHRANAKPPVLSGGEAQRVALARALVAEPSLLLLDEPLSALDVRARAEIRGLLRSVLTGFPGVRVLVTHDPIEAMTLADRLVLIERGLVTQSGTPAEIRDAPRTSYAAELVGLNLFSGRLERLPDGAGLLRTGAGDIVVGWPQDAGAATGSAIGLLKPADVSLFAERPEGSARNVFRGRVTAISLETDRARVRLDTQPPLVAEVTPGSVERLGLREGMEVWTSFKAVEVRVVLT